MEQAKSLIQDAVSKTYYDEYWCVYMPVSIGHAHVPRSGGKTWEMFRAVLEMDDVIKASTSRSESDIPPLMIDRPKWEAPGPPIKQRRRSY